MNSISSLYQESLNKFNLFILAYNYNNYGCNKNISCPNLSIFLDFELLIFYAVYSSSNTKKDI